MLVKDPPPRNKFVPRAEPATIFGPCNSVSNGMWTYQKGVVRVKTNLAIQGMTQHDLAWVKINMSNWDPPDCPLPLPEAELYDAASLIPAQDVGGAATRQTVTCLACLATRRKQKNSEPHDLVWGECLKATPPPPVAISEPVEVVDSEPPVPAEAEEESELYVADLFSDAEGVAEDDSQNQENAIVSRVGVDDKCISSPYTREKLIEHPHACVAFSDAATWGSHHTSLMSDTDVPSSTDELTASMKVLTRRLTLMMNM